MKYIVAHKISLNAYISEWSKNLGNFRNGRLLVSEYNFVHPLQL